MKGLNLYFHVEGLHSMDMRSEVKGWAVNFIFHFIPFYTVGFFSISVVVLYSFKEPKNRGHHIFSELKTTIYKFQGIFCFQERLPKVMH